MILFPETDTLWPNPSLSVPPLAVSFETSDHVPSELFSNTYAEPEPSPSSSSKGDPTTAIDPETDTLRPNSSWAAPSLAVSFEPSVNVTVNASSGTKNISEKTSRYIPGIFRLLLPETQLGLIMALSSINEVFQEP